MIFFGLSGLINGLSAGFLGIFVLSRKPHDIRHKIYALFCLCLSVWSFAYFKWLLAEDASTALFWARIFMAGAIFIPPTAFHHLVKLLGKKVPYGFLAGNYVFSLLFFSGDLGPWIVRGVGPKISFPYWPSPGPLFHLHLFQFAALALMGLWILGQELRKSDGLHRNQIKFLILAEVVGWTGGFTNYPLWYDIPVSPYGNILVSAYTGIFAYAMVRYRLLDIDIVIKRSLIYAFLLLALLIPCYILIIWTQLVFFGEVSPTFSFISLILLILVGFLFPKFRFRTEEALERVLFKKRYDYRETLLLSSREMISVVDLGTLSNRLVHTVGRAMGIEKTSLFLFDETKGSYALKGSAGLDMERMRETILLAGNPLVQRLSKTPDALVKEELEISQNGQREKELTRQMGQLEAEVTLPLMSKERLIGILNLGHREGMGMYSQEDLEVLSTLANQAAIAIDNAQLYENLKQSQSIIHRANRLSSLGMLTAGLAHEIRNPLVAIRTFTQLLPERYGDTEFRESFQSIALMEVDRICGLVNDLLSFARPSTPQVSRGDVNEIVEAITRILSTEAKEKGVTVNLRLAAGLPKILVDKEQLKQVSMNVILNAIQSIENVGVVEVSSRLFLKDNRERFIQIEVRDTGIGIPERDMENIFNPFFTTKEDGSGLGLSISHQIVKEHGGYMAVESKVGVGTSFYINLPASQVEYRRALDSPQIHEKDFGC